jgi:choline dehydrogenase
MINSLRLILRTTRTEPLASIINHDSDDPLLDHRLHDASDDDLAAIIRDRAETIYHPACTARMAPLADGGVVNANLKVYGIDNLRICDTSVFPTITR